MIGMINCGIGACSANSATCTAQVINITFEVVGGIVDFIEAIVTAGASLTDEAQALIQDGISDWITSYGDSNAQAANTIITNLVSTPSYLKRYAEKVTDQLASTYIPGVSTKDLQDICFYVVAQSSINVSDATDVSLSATYDFAGADSLLYPCSGDMSVPDEKYNCASLILNYISLIDTTGIISIASAVANPICEVDT